MGLSKKKIVMFLLSIALCSGATFVYSTQSDTNESTKSLFDNSGSLHDNQPNLTVSPDDNPGTRELFFKMTLSVFLVVVLGIAVVYISKKFLPRFTHLPSKRIRIIETVHLGPRKTVYLLKIGNQQLLIGSTNENITRLADVTDQPFEIDPPTTQINNN